MKIEETSDAKIKETAARMVQDLSLILTDEYLKKNLKLSIQTIRKIRRNKYNCVLSAAVFKRMEILHNDYITRELFE